MGNGSGHRSRPSSRARRSRLKDLLCRGYRCLALLEELGAGPLLRAAAASGGVAVVSEDGAASAGRSGGGGGEELQWRGGKLVLDTELRKRVSEFDPFHEVFLPRRERVNQIIRLLYTV